MMTDQKKVYRPGSKRPINDLTGQRFGMLTVLGLAETPEWDTHNRVYWRCKCDCGAEKTVLGNNLKYGSVRSCGCLSGRIPYERRKEIPKKMEVEVDRSHFSDDWMFLAQGKRNITRPIRTINGDWI